jgi:hypothetical protein
MELAYTATSLEDIARMFDERARMCEDQARTIKRNQKTRTYYSAQAGVWSTAAEILRQTELKPKE